MVVASRFGQYFIVYCSEHCIVFMCDDIKVTMATSTEEVREGGIRRSEGQLL